MDLYREEILDHFKNPLNYGRLKSPTITIESSNPLCGDKIILDLMVKNGVVTGVGFEAVGCALSVASASILSDKILNSSIRDILNMPKEDLVSLFGEEITISRIKCVLLSYNATREALIAIK